MMKKYISIYLKVFLIINLVFMVLAIVVFRRADIRLPFAKLELGVIIMSAIISLAIFIYKLEKGNSIVNVILAYLIVIPSLFVLRNNFGTYLFRSAWVIYILMIIIGIIYGIALLFVSKKYKAEVEQLNKLIKEKTEEEELKN